jgi:hypothetical protein
VSFAEEDTCMCQRRRRRRTRKRGAYSDGVAGSWCSLFSILGASVCRLLLD